MTPGSAASMYVHGVTQLLTVNVRDFQRFPLAPHRASGPKWSARRNSHEHKP